MKEKLKNNIHTRQDGLWYECCFLLEKCSMQWGKNRYAVSEWHWFLFNKNFNENCEHLITEQL